MLLGGASHGPLERAPPWVHHLGTSASRWANVARFSTSFHLFIRDSSHDSFPYFLSFLSIQIFLREIIVH
jgi:hypothetical protein